MPSALSIAFVLPFKEAVFLLFQFELGYRKILHYIHVVIYGHFFVSQ